MNRLLCTAFLAITLAACSRPADDVPVVRIGAAADLKFALDVLLSESSDEICDFRVEVTYGSSGNLRTQIEQGAPFDLFLSADFRFPEQLVSAGLADRKTLFSYAIGRLVLWVPMDSPIDVETLQERALLAPEVRKIAIANPEHAPYGQAAVAALRNYGLLEQVAPRFVMGENIAQTAQFVDSGAADIGIIALSLAVSPKMREQGRFWEIPLDKIPRLLQGGVIIKASPHAVEAGKLISLLQSEKGRAILQRYGFLIPETASTHSEAHAAH